MTIRTKLMLLIAVSVLALVCATGIFLHQMAQLTAADAAFTTQQLRTQDHARKVQLEFKKQVQSWKDILLRGSDPASFDKYRTEFFSWDATIRETAKQLETEINSAEVRSQVEKFLDAHEQLDRDYATALGAFVASNRVDFRTADQIVKGKDRPVTDIIDQVVAGINEQSQQSLRARSAQTARTYWTATVASLLAAGLLAVFGRFISRQILNPLAAVVERIKDVAQGDRDLSLRVEIASQDELGDLAKWFNLLMGKLRRTLSNMSRNTSSLAAAGEEISATSRQQTQGTELQKDQTNQVATAMQEMATTVQQISENSSSAAAASQQASEAARQGGKIVEEALSGMRTIAQSVGETAKKVEELGKRSDQIGQIIGVIDDIADQTNLLALNAAIEAARAGEQGRGFAVVADEVRKLAERTSGATKEITDMIRSIQAETKNAVTAMHAGTKEVELGVELTTQAGSSLHNIIQMSERVGDMVTHIATAATQQSAATEQINGSIERIAKITAASAADARQTTSALADLATLAADLQELADQFRLGAEANDRQDRELLQNQAGASDSDTGDAANLDFARVKMGHRSWRLKLRGFLDGRENLNPRTLASHRDCELGKWIYAEAMNRYGDWREVQELEKTHESMHTLVRRIVELKHNDKTEEAEQEFSRVSDASEKVIALITQVEQKLKRTSAVSPRAAAQAAGA
jgi:methyl-accepting chemotaxis protein